MCFPAGEQRIQPTVRASASVNSFSFYRGVRMVGDHASLLSLNGKTDEAASELLAIADRLAYYETHCHRLLYDQLSWLTSRRVLMSYWAYLVVNPALSQQNVAAILERLARWGSASCNPIADTLRYEARWVLAHIDEGLRKNRSPESASLSRVWPQIGPVRSEFTWEIWPTLLKCWLKLLIPWFTSSKTRPLAY